MKYTHFLFLAAIALMSAALPTISTYTLNKDYKVTINGTSNLHNWDETVGTVIGGSAISWNTDGTFNLEGVNLQMNVRSIKSDMGSVMNNNTYKALKADVCPEITFKLSTPIKSLAAGGSPVPVSAEGTLTIAGVTNSVIINGTVTMEQHGRLEFEGAQTIKMTDYGVSPPTALFGTMKTGNSITIKFKTNYSLAIN